MPADTSFVSANEELISNVYAAKERLDAEDLALQERLAVESYSDNHEIFHAQNRASIELNEALDRAPFMDPRTGTFFIGEHFFVRHTEDPYFEEKIHEAVCQVETNIEAILLQEKHECEEDNIRGTSFFILLDEALRRWDDDNGVLIRAIIDTAPKLRWLFDNHYFRFAYTSEHVLYAIQHNINVFDTQNIPQDILDREADLWARYKQGHIRWVRGDPIPE